MTQLEVEALARLTGATLSQGTPAGNNGWTLIRKSNELDIVTIMTDGRIYGRNNLATCIRLIIAAQKAKLA